MLLLLTLFILLLFLLLYTRVLVLLSLSQSACLRRYHEYAKARIVGNEEMRERDVAVRSFVRLFVDSTAVFGGKLISLFLRALVPRCLLN